MTTEDLIAGDVDVAILGSTTDGNLLKGTNIAANVLRGFWNSSATIWSAHGGGKMQREKDGPQEQYLRTYLQELNIVDYGNAANHLLSLDKSTEELRVVVREILDGDAMPLVVGGSHDNMYGIFLAVVDKYGKGNYGVIHFDSHYDGADFGWGFYAHNGNGIYWGLRNGLFKGEDLVQVSMTGGGPDDAGLKQMEDFGIRWHFQAEIERDSWDEVLKRFLEEVKDIENLVVTVDIDMLSSTVAPGTSGREVDGPDWAELNKALRALMIQNNVVAVEISEYNPLMDNKSGWQTAMGVNYAMRHTLAGLAARRQGITDPFHYHPKMVDDGR
jgi:agmatinase